MKSWRATRSKHGNKQVQRSIHVKSSPKHRQDDKGIARWQANLVYVKKATVHERSNDMTNQEGKWSMDSALPRRSSNNDFMTSKERRRSSSKRTQKEEVVDGWTSPWLIGSYNKFPITKELGQVPCQRILGHVFLNWEEEIDTKFLSSLGKKEWEDWVIIWHLILFEDV